MFSNCGVCESLLLKVYLFKNTVNKSAKESISLKVQKNKVLLLLVHYATFYSPKVIPSYALSCCLTAYQGSSPVARDADIILLTDNKTRLVYIMEMVKF